MKLAVVGASKLPRSLWRAATSAIVDAIGRHDATEIVSGGAEGVDTIAEITAYALGLGFTPFLPDVQQWHDHGGLRGFKSRNKQIALHGDRLFRVAYGGSTTFGSGWTEQYARELCGKPTETVTLE